MESMFEDSIFNQYIGGWNVENVSTMFLMFSNSHFNQDISQWNTSKVESMSCMFNNCPIDQDLNNWNIEKATDLKFIFSDCKGQKPWWNIEDNDLRKHATEKRKLTEELYLDLNHNVKDSKKIKV